MSAGADRPALLRLARLIEWLTISWCALEAGAALYAGIRGRSVSLVAFGADSVIETLAAFVVLRRLGAEASGASPRETEHEDRRALRLVGLSFFLLAAYPAAIRSWSGRPVGGWS